MTPSSPAFDWTAYGTGPGTSGYVNQAKQYCEGFGCLWEGDKNETWYKGELKPTYCGCNPSISGDGCFSHCPNLIQGDCTKYGCHWSPASGECHGTTIGINVPPGEEPCRPVEALANVKSAIKNKERPAPLHTIVHKSSYT